MNPREFIEKWQGSTLTERQSYQAHFVDLCALVGAATPTPATADSYCYERGVAKTGSKHGWADVWKKSCFGFEYKAPDRNLDAALKQLMTYALALDNPPLLVVCDTQIIQIHTHFTNAPSEVHTIALQDIGEPDNLQKLKWLFEDPDKFHPKLPRVSARRNGVGEKIFLCAAPGVGVFVDRARAGCRANGF